MNIKTVVVCLIMICQSCLCNAAAVVSKDVSAVTELISAVEIEHDIPKGLLLSIAKVESDLNPCAVNVAGTSHYTQDKSVALARINKALLKGVQNIDIGIMQINYAWHSDNFDSVSEMLDPKANIEYAAQFLTQLYKAHGSWNQAVRMYHSADPKHHKRYSRKIVLAWTGA